MFNGEIVLEELEIFSVEEISLHLKHLIEMNLQTLYIEGEVANFIHHRSGHMYFSLKDDKATLRCTFFKQKNMYSEFYPHNGDKVIALGKITIYPPSGSYQLNIDRIYPSGKGLLQIKFEQLKRKLTAEGLFNDEHKQVIPKFPQRIGVITSATGAALQDIQNVIFRRYPVTLAIYPALMQGKNASKTIVAGVEYFQQHDNIDTLIIARGGGSQEDLFVFNDEDIVRAIYNCHIPIITGVGHEIDFTLADFAADLRAPTPSAAAELAVPNREQLRKELNSLIGEVNALISGNISFRIQQINKFDNLLNRVNIPNKIQTQKIELIKINQKLNEYANITNVIANKIQTLNNNLKNAFSKNATNLLLNGRNFIRITDDYLSRECKNKLSTESYEIAKYKATLESSSPYNILAKGFAFVSRGDKIISSTDDLKLNQLVKIQFSDGKAIAQIKEKTKNEN